MKIVRSAARVWILLCTVGISSFNCKEDTSSTPQSPSIPRDRTVAVSPVPRLVPPPTTSDFLNAVNIPYNAGARGEFISVRWSEIEPTAGPMRLSDLANGLNYLGNLRGFDILLGIQVLNTTAKETPLDLRDVPFDSSLMKQRFHQLIDSLHPFLNSHIRYISIGNEVDVYLAMHPGEWTAYRDFYDDAISYIHTLLPSVKVGVTSTFGGANGSQGGNVAALNASSDVFMLTYYPLQGDFLVRSPDAPLADFPQMVSLAGGKPLILQEVGYPTSSTLASSDQLQADFVMNVYSAWQSEGTRIPFLNFFALHDFTPELCDSLLHYYGAPDSAVNFRAYLGSLGLRSMDGTPKAGWTAFVGGAGTVH